MILMQTNVLSQIPECFNLGSPNVPVKHGDIYKESRPPKTQVFVQKRPKNEPLVRTISDVEKITHFQKRSNKQRRENTEDSNSKLPSASQERFADQTEADQDQDPPSYAYQKTKSKIQWKTKTKIRRSNWKSRSAPIIRRNEEITSCTEFSQETNISFAAYVKKRTPNLNISKKSKTKGQKLRRTQGSENINLVGFAGKDESLESASKRNVTFNPIFQEDEVLKSHDKHVRRENRAGDCRVDSKMVDNEGKMNTPSRDTHVKSTPKTRSDHMITDYESTKKHDAEIQGRNNVHEYLKYSIKHIRESSNDEVVKDHVPVTCIDEILTEFDEENYTDHVPVTSIDQNFNDHVPVTCIDQESYNDHVPVTCIDQEYNHVPVTCIDEIFDEDDHLRRQSNHMDNHTKKPTLIRAGSQQDLDMCNWYDEDYDYDSNKDYDDDDDDFETRMLRRTATILTFDMTSRRRELYTIEEQPNEE